MVQKFIDQAEHKVSAKVGEKFTLDIQVNAASGYELSQPKFDQSALKLVDSKQEPQLRGFGGALTMHLTFEALSPGEHKIELETKRQWEDRAFVSIYKVSVA